MSADQLLLFDEGELVPRELSLEESVRRARAFVASVLRRRPCVRCCGDERLVFVHRRPMRALWDAPVARLVQRGVSLVRLREEIAKCDVICRRCLLGRTRPQMLRSSRSSSVGIVAKAPTTTGRGRNGAAVLRAKALRIVGKKNRVA